MPSDTVNNPLENNQPAGSPVVNGDTMVPAPEPAPTPTPAPEQAPPPAPEPAPTPTPAPEQAPPPTPAPTSTPEQTPAPIPTSAPAAESASTPPTGSIFSKILQFKKYAIAILAGIVFVPIIYAAYGFFFKSENIENAETSGLPTELGNSLSESDTETTNSSNETETPDPSDLERVVNELKDPSSETADNSAPPGIDIVIPEDTMMTPFLPPASPDTEADPVADTNPDSGTDSNTASVSGSDSTDFSGNSDTSTVVPR